MLVAESALVNYRPGMEHAFWKSRWDEGRTGFHRAEASPELVRWADEVLVERAAALVPLCGKSLDLLWLAQRFGQVVGVEFVRDAVVELFDALGVTPTIRVVAGAEVFGHANLNVIVQDIFAVTAAELPPISAVWDRAALIALPPDVRGRYAAHIQSLMGAAARGLLVTIDYPQGLMPGPPFAVSDDEVTTRYPSARRLAHARLVERRPNLPADALTTTSVFSF